MVLFYSISQSKKYYNHKKSKDIYILHYDKAYFSARGKFLRDESVVFEYFSVIHPKR